MEKGELLKEIKDVLSDYKDKASNLESRLFQLKIGIISVSATILFMGISLNMKEIPDTHNLSNFLILYPLTIPIIYLITYLRDILGSTEFDKELLEDDPEVKKIIYRFSNVLTFLLLLSVIFTFYFFFINLSIDFTCNFKFFSAMIILGFFTLFLFSNIMSEKVIRFFLKSELEYSNLNKLVGSILVSIPVILILMLIHRMNIFIEFWKFSLIIFFLAFATNLFLSLYFKMYFEYKYYENMALELEELKDDLIKSKRHFKRIEKEFFELI